MTEKRPPTPTNRLPILVSYQSICVFIAVPKRRGHGYLKRPAGHHYEKWLSDAESISECSICGLDGCLELEVRNQESGKLAVASIADLLMKEFNSPQILEASLNDVLDASSNRFVKEAA